MINRLARLAISATLIMLAAGVPLTAAAAPASQSLANTFWVLTEYTVQGSSAPVTALGEPPPTLIFRGGMVSGYTICNEYNGPYSESGNQVTFGPLVTTRRACTNPEFVAQEALFLQVMDGTTTATRSAGSLVISAPAGTLTFAAADESDVTDVPVIPPTPGMPITGQPAMEWPLLSLLALALSTVLLGVYLRRAEQTR